MNTLRLKEALTEALKAGRSGSSKAALGSESPANMAIRLLDSLIVGDEVGGADCWR